MRDGTHIKTHLEWLSFCYALVHEQSPGTFSSNQGALARRDLAGA